MYHTISKFSRPYAASLYLGKIMKWLRVVVGTRIKRIKSQTHNRIGESNIQNNHTHTGTKYGKTNINKNSRKTAVSFEDLNLKHPMMAS
jgi:hypothetical protein